MGENIIYKYQLELVEHQVIKVPNRRIILDIRIQDELYYVWSLVDNRLEDKDLSIYLRGTGTSDNMQDKRYITTLQDKHMMWHFFTDWDERVKN